MAVRYPFIRSQTPVRTESSSGMEQVSGLQEGHKEEIEKTFVDHGLEGGRVGIQKGPGALF